MMLRKKSLGQNFLQSAHYLEAIAGADWYWHAAKGRVRPDEPLYGVGLYRPDDPDCNLVVKGEGHTMQEAVAHLRTELSKLVKH